ncbi:MAG: hypothetical protein ABJD97_02535 [Betaproteobacteria bacterium]
MATPVNIKEKAAANGKIKYQAIVWYNNAFIASKTFDSRPLAAQFYTRTYEQAVSGKAKPASERRADRKVSESVDRSMSSWAELYIEKHGKDHGDTRVSDYAIVGRLLKGRKLSHFSGKAGGQLIRDLAEEWRFIRLPRTKKEGARCSSNKPIADQTLRLRLTALSRLIAFAASNVPEAAGFQAPVKAFGFELPKAHGIKRTRQPSDAEYARILDRVGRESALGHFLRVVDDTGCRLGEVRSAQGKDVQFFGVAGQVLGGVLKLNAHKTVKRVGARDVPLSLYAAQVLHARKQLYGERSLFPELKNTGDVCDAFDDVCTALEIEALQIKDFRRAFINRNVATVSSAELIHVVGKTSLLEEKARSQRESDTLAAVGHTSLSTMVGYVTPHMQSLSQVFTGTSRWSRVAESSAGQHKSGGIPGVGEMAAAHREVIEAIAKLKRLGLMTTSI